MIRKIHTVKINLPGGSIAVEKLKIVLLAAEKARVDELRFGTRQQLYIFVQDNFLEAFAIELHLNDIAYEENQDIYPNIMSSDVTQGIFQNTEWLNSKHYKEITASFDYTPSLKINIVDSQQSLVPFYTGNINFISSSQNNCWHLYLRFPKTNIIYSWPNLVSSSNIAVTAKLVEETILLNKQLFYDQPMIDGKLLYDMIANGEEETPGATLQQFEPTAFRLPYYEGFNQYGNKMWLGIYRREETFPVAFLKEMCELGIATKVGYLYSTPWKSIIFKDIQIKSRKLWENILGRYRINVRHASNELNWQVADLSEEGLNLKRYIIRQFDKDDLRTFGLCFAIEIHQKIGLFGSVVIYKHPNHSSNQRRSLDRYDILYTKNFDPNAKEYITFRSDLLKEHLGTYLVSLCKFYYDQV